MQRCDKPPASARPARLLDKTTLILSYMSHRETPSIPRNIPDTTPLYICPQFGVVTETHTKAEGTCRTTENRTHFAEVLAALGLVEDEY